MTGPTENVLFQVTAFDTKSGVHTRGLSTIKQMMEAARDAAMILTNDLPILQQSAEEQGPLVQPHARHLFQQDCPKIKDVQAVLNSVQASFQEQILQFINKYSNAIGIDSENFALESLRNSNELQKLLSYMYIHSPETFLHSIEIVAIMDSWYTLQGFNSKYQDITSIAALVHDGGKGLLVPEVLHFPKKLTTQEKAAPLTSLGIPQVPQNFQRFTFHEYISRHTQLGAELWPFLSRGIEQSPLDKEIAKHCIITHHGNNQPPYHNDMRLLSSHMQFADLTSALTQLRCYNPGLRPKDNLIKHLETLTSRIYQNDKLPLTARQFLNDSIPWNIIYTGYAHLVSADLLGYQPNPDPIPHSALTLTYKSH